MSIKNKIHTIEADITTIKVDAIVNAANERLLGGGGVDGAIHRAAGPKLLEECLKFPIRGPKGERCPTGCVKVTPGFDLPSKFIIHAVGPRWKSSGNISENYEDRDLESCYSESLYTAKHLGLKSIAFPAISTGIFGFPIGLACEIALDTIKSFFKYNDKGSIQQVLLVTFMSEKVSFKYKKLGIKECKEQVLQAR